MFVPPYGGEMTPEMSARSITDLVKQRSMLVILIAACTSAKTAFEAADNLIDADLLVELSKMIERSEVELKKLTERIEGSA
jgi:hypothetical protein